MTARKIPLVDVQSLHQVQRERRRRVTVAALRSIKITVLCKKEEVVLNSENVEAGDEDAELDAPAQHQTNENSPQILAREPRKSVVQEGGDGQAKNEEAFNGGEDGGNSEEEAAAAVEPEIRRNPAEITLDICVGEFRSEWQLACLDFSWLQELDANIRKAFKLPLPRYEAFGFEDSEAPPPPSPHAQALQQRSQDLLAAKIGPDTLSDSDTSETEREELEIMQVPLPRRAAVLCKVSKESYVCIFSAAAA